MSFIVINNISWNRPDGSPLLQNINFTCGNEKTGLTGRNGSGKSVLAQIISGSLPPSAGSIDRNCSISILPQNLDQFRSLSIISMFGLSDQYIALKRVLSGSGTDTDFSLIEDCWDLEQKLTSALKSTGIEYLSPERMFDTLSGGEQIRCALSSILVTRPKFIILDEPTNHLDENMRRFVYDFVRTYNSGMLIISHDRELLRIMDRIIELDSGKATIYGGNYNFFAEQKALLRNALEENLQSAERSLEKKISDMNTAVNRQNKKIHRAAINSENGGTPKSVLNKRKGRGENTSAYIKQMHEKRIIDGTQMLHEAKARLPAEYKMMLDYEDNRMPGSKKICMLANVNLTRDGINQLWPEPINFSLIGNQRIHLRGDNGSGKSSLLKLIFGELRPSCGTVYTGVSSIVVLDQEMSMLDDTQTILGNMIRHTDGKMPEHEMRIKLARLLFFNEDVHKSVKVLSGGERIRAGLACVFNSVNAPELILLDEPTNNLDLTSINQMTTVLNQYHGPMIVISHDKEFINELRVTGQFLLRRQAGV